MVGREESSSKCRGLCINRGGYLIPRRDNFEEKLLNDYLISSDLIIHRVVLQKFGSIIGNNRSFGIYAHTIGQEMNRFGNLVRGIFGTDPIQTKMNSLESSFIFDNHAFRKLGWNANDLLNRILKIELQPKLHGKTGSSYPGSIEHFRPFDMELRDLQELRKGREEQKPIYLAEFKTYGNPEVTTDSSEYNINLFLSKENYEKLRSSPVEYKYKLRLNLGDMVDNSSPFDLLGMPGRK